MEWELRSITHDDVPAWNTLLATAEKVDQTGEVYNEADLHEEIDDDHVALDDRAGAWIGDTMVGFAALRPRATADDHWRVFAEGCTDPAFRGQGLGSRLLAWSASRASAVRDERFPGLDVRIHRIAFQRNVTQVELLEDQGNTAVQWSAQMRIQLDQHRAAEPPDVPAGYAVHQYGPQWSAATLAAHNAAFMDHWGFLPWSDSLWRQWHDDARAARPDISWVLVHESDPATVVGYAVTQEFDAYAQLTGRREAYLAKLGVRREHRGRGLASMLLRQGLHAYAAAGFDEASLDVDLDNPTGAVKLYERVGYEVQRRTVTYEQVLPGPASGSIGT